MEVLGIEISYCIGGTSKNGLIRSNGKTDKIAKNHHFRTLDIDQKERKEKGAEKCWGENNG